jgi:hypothetical protein
MSTPYGSWPAPVSLSLSLLPGRRCPGRCWSVTRCGGLRVARPKRAVTWWSVVTWRTGGRRTSCRRPGTPAPRVHEYGARSGRRVRPCLAHFTDQRLCGWCPASSHPPPGPPGPQTHEVWCGGSGTWPVRSARPWPLCRPSTARGQVRELVSGCDLLASPGGCRRTAGTSPDRSGPPADAVWDGTELRGVAEVPARVVGASRHSPVG